MSRVSYIAHNIDFQTIQIAFTFVCVCAFKMCFAHSVHTEVSAEVFLLLLPLCVCEDAEGSKRVTHWGS